MKHILTEASPNMAKPDWPQQYRNKTNKISNFFGLCFDKAAAAH
jgi:hypothetical protein